MPARDTTNRVRDIRTDEQGRVYTINTDVAGNPINPGLTDAQLRAAAVPVEPLGQPSIPRQIPVTIVSANQVLTTTCRRISITAEGCKMRYLVGDVAQTASATTSHMIRDGERLDVAVPPNGHIAAIRDSAATANGVLEISELV